MKSMDLKLTGSAYGGDAFGRDDSGRMIFVPFALSGENVRVEIFEDHAHWARARLLEVLEASPERITPRCRHFADCGGCHYQHIPYAAQLKIKSEILHSQLERLGGFQDPPVETTVPSPSAWNTRNHIQFSLTSNGQLGFKAASSDRVIAIEECHLPEPVLVDLWPRLDLEAVAGVTRVAMRAGAEDECMILLHGQGNPEVEVEIDLPASIVWLGPGGAAVLAGEGYLFFEVLGRPFKVSANSFFQVHTHLAGELIGGALKALAIQPGETVFDLYAGVGLFSAFLAQEGAKVVAVEESPWACTDFETNLMEFDGVELYEAAVEIALPSISSRPDAVLVDPPRAGISREALQKLIEIAPPRLVYVSCDTATLARDGKHLYEAGYRLERATPIDLFPQTYHIETLSVWKRGA
jgi:23S rRNA (uracil1939-C5)-methyltransferase